MKHGTHNLGARLREPTFAKIDDEGLLLVEYGTPTTKLRLTPAQVQALKELLE